MRKSAVHTVQINEKLFKEAPRQAREAGFSSVDEFVAARLEREFSESGESFDHLFTPEVIGELDRISGGIREGAKTYTMRQAEAHFERKRKEWLRNHAS